MRGCMAPSCRLSPPRCSGKSKRFQRRVHRDHLETRTETTDAKLSIAEDVSQGMTSVVPMSCKALFPSRLAPAVHSHRNVSAVAQRPKGQGRSRSARLKSSPDSCPPNKRSLGHSRALDSDILRAADDMFNCQSVLGKRPLRVLLRRDDCPVAHVDDAVTMGSRFRVVSDHQHRLP